MSWLTPEVLDVLVHVDAEADLAPERAARDLPERDVLLAHLRELLGEAAGDPDRVVLHYLGNRVEVEWVLAPDATAGLSRIEELRRRIAERLPDDPWFTRITVLERIAPK